MKVNFDGASKGNFRPMGFGGVFHNEEGVILCHNTWYIGYDTNNTVEHWELIHDIQIIVKNNYYQLIIEGD